MSKIRGQKLVEEYAAFSEKLSPQDLEDMKSIVKKDPNQLYKSVKTIIMNLKKDISLNFLIKIVGTNHDNSKNFIDMKKLSDNYETQSYADSLAASMGTFFNNEIEELNVIGPPDNPMLRKRFKEFQEELRDQKKDYEKLIEENSNYALDYSFGNVEDASELTEAQALNRKNMMKMKEDDQEMFNILWVRGEFHLATLISRLENTNYTETLLMREEILKRNQISIEVKDYGLTISEILSGLQVAKKVNERYLYKAFSDGNLNLKAMILLLRNADLIEEEDRFAALKTLQALCNDAGMHKIAQDADRYTAIRRIIKKYNLPTHKNWRKEDDSK